MHFGEYLMVALGGAIGALVRHAVGAVLSPYTGVIAYGTFTVNVTGSFLFGVLASIGAIGLLPSLELRAFLFVGLLGGYTTFSAFSLDVILLIERGRPALAVGYALASVLLSVGGLFAGMRLTRMFWP